MGQGGATHPLPQCYDKTKLMPELKAFFVVFLTQNLSPSSHPKNQKSTTPYLKIWIFTTALQHSEDQQYAIVFE